MTSNDEVIEYGNVDSLYHADPDCEHEIIALWSGVKCRKCGGWYCA